jgi:hypothetical protein
MIGVKYRRTFAAFMAFITVLTMMAASSGGLIKEDEKVVVELSRDDQKTVNDISNLTGAKVDDIVNLRVSGRSWNDILDMLKKRTGGIEQGVEDRSGLLAGVGFSKNCLNRLKAEGYKEDDITEAKMLIERVIYQLKEINGSQNEEDAGVLPDIMGEEKRNEEISTYHELLEKIDLEVAVCLILKLNKDFGSMEKVFDEYLYCLQIGMDMQKYLADKKAYEKERQEKSAGFDLQKIITIEKIEVKMLELLQKKNEKNNMQAIPENKTNTIDDKEDATNKMDDFLTSPVPEISSVKPKNPGEDLTQEVNGIRNKALNPN